MINADRILKFLMERDEGYDDDELSNKLRIYPRQQVNQICRRLASQNKIIRKRVEGKIKNFPYTEKWRVALQERRLPVKKAPLEISHEEFLDELKTLGERLMFETEDKVRIEGGEIDHVWYLNLGSELPYFGSRIPIAGFEIETSWRTRKHIKGDIFNLLILRPAFGIVLFLRKGFRSESEFKGNMEAAKRFTEQFRGISHILVWSEEDVDKLERIMDKLRK
jgi:hypothetical protein